MLVYDFLFGQGIQCGGELKQYITKHKSALQSCLARLKIRAKVHRNEDLLPKDALETGVNKKKLIILGSYLKMVYSTALDVTIVASKAVEYAISKYCLNIALLPLNTCT